MSRFGSLVPAEVAGPARKILDSSSSIGGHPLNDLGGVNIQEQWDYLVALFRKLEEAA